MPQPCTIKSSAKLATPSQPCKTSATIFWYLSGANVAPNVKCLYLYKPRCVTNVVISRDLSSSSTWCKPHLRSSFEKTVEPLRSYKTSSIVGMGCLSLSIAEFALRMSTQIRTSPSAFGTTTNGETYSVGLCDTSLIMSLATSSSNFSSTLALKPNGSLHTGCATGVTWSFICNFS